MTNMTGSKLSIFSHPWKITGYWITTRSLPYRGPYEDDFFRRVLFLIFLRCHVNCDGQWLKHIIGFSVILLQTQLDIYDSNNDRIQNCSVTEHHLYR
jgi:hypothetical protein